MLQQCSQIKNQFCKTIPPFYEKYAHQLLNEFIKKVILAIVRGGFLNRNKIANYFLGFIPFAIAAFLVGIGSAAIAPVVMSYIVTEFPPEKQAKGFSFYMLILVRKVSI